MRIAERPAAVVLGLGLNGLGIVRSLAKAPFRLAIHAFDSDLGQPGAYTRHATKHRSPPLDSPALLETLVAFGRRQPTPPVLFVTQEKTAELVSAHRDALEPHFRLVLPPHAVLTRLMDKTTFHAAAAAAGFPVPHTVTVQAPDDLEQARHMPLPCILKPAQRDAAYERRFKKAYKVASFAELVRLASDILPVIRPLVVQEWIEGGDSAIFFCLQFRSAGGGTLAHFTGRKIRSWPPAVGGTASCTAAPDADPVLRPLTDRFFAATGAAGFVSMEYKLDARSGRYLMVEPTVGRSDHQEEVATLNGVNIPLVAYSHLAGLGPPPVLSSPPVIWRDPVADTLSARSGGDARMPPGKVVDAYFRPADPGPALARLAAPLRRLARPPRKPPDRPGGGPERPAREHPCVVPTSRPASRHIILDRAAGQSRRVRSTSCGLSGSSARTTPWPGCCPDDRDRRQNPAIPPFSAGGCDSLSPWVRSRVPGFVRRFPGFVRRIGGFVRRFPGSFAGSFVANRAKCAAICAIRNAYGAYSGEDYDKLARIAAHHVHTCSV